MSGECLKIKGVFMARVVYENTNYFLPLYVSDNMVNNIVGRSWLAAIHNVDWNQKVFSEKIEQESLREIGTYAETPTLNLNINGFPIKAQIDTGSQITAITEKTWEEIGKPGLRKSINRVVDATLKKIADKGFCTVTIYERTYEIIVLRETEKVQNNIIGMDVLQDLKNIDLNEIFKNLIK
jgi:predicted aspartyl protease